MKKTRLVAGLLLVMLFTAVNCVMALAGTSKINGHLDSVEGKAVSGWLWDPKTGGKPDRHRYRHRRTQRTGGGSRIRPGL